MESTEELRARLIQEFSAEAAEFERRIEFWGTGTLSVTHNGNDVSAEFVSGLREAKARLERAVDELRRQ